MKLAFLIFLFAQSGMTAGLIGTWKFTEYTYEGQTQPAPNPQLDLRFTFNDQGISLLKWFRTDESGFCERTAEYKVENKNKLRQKINWLNPLNDANCSKDPDMQLGHETVTAFRIEKNKLAFELELNEKPFLYILTSIP